MLHARTCYGPCLIVQRQLTGRPLNTHGWPRLMPWLTEANDDGSGGPLTLCSEKEVRNVPIPQPDEV